jgi:hypothetical protein
MAGARKENIREKARIRITQQSAFDTTTCLNFDSQRGSLCFLRLGIHGLLSKLPSTPVTCVLSKEFIVVVGLL